MDYYLVILLAGLVGLFAGFLSGMLGIGGGSIRVPLLNLLGFDLLVAFGINLLTIPFSALFGAKSHIDNIDMKTTLFLTLGGCGGTLVGLVLAFHLSLSKLLLPAIFFLSSILTVLGLNLYKISPKISSKLKPTAFNIILGAMTLNFITGLKGGSGGSLFPPFLKTLGYDIHKAIAISLLTTFFTSITGVFYYYFKGIPFASEGMVVILGSIIGVKLGSVVSIKTKPRMLEVTLSIIVVLLALIPLIKAIIKILSIS